MRSVKLLWQRQCTNLTKRFQLVRCYSASLPYRAGSSGKVINHNVEKSPITVQLWNERLKHNAFNANEKPMHAPTNLLEKSAADCRLTVRYNFSSDQNLRDAYVDTLGDVLTGKLLEDLDALAGNVAFMHCDDNDPETRPLSLVTASVDRIRQTNRISASDDIVLVGQVAWVGRSSLDILMEIHRVPTGHETSFAPTMITEPSDTRLLTSIFTYVARDKVTGKACQVNRYLPQEASEQSLYTHRETLANTRKAAAKKTSSSPVATEQTSGGSPTGTSLDLVSLLQLGHAMEDMPALNHHHAVLMKHTGLENCLLCQPQNTNTGGKVFGGFLSKQLISTPPALIPPPPPPSPLLLPLNTSLSDNINLSALSYFDINVTYQCIVLTVWQKPPPISSPVCDHISWKWIALNSRNR